jgi:hypothetical protein
MVFKRKIGLPSERATRKLTDDHGLVGIWRRYNPVISLSRVYHLEKVQYLMAHLSRMKM